MWLYLNGCDQSPTAKSIPTVKECFFLEWFVVYCPKHPSGMISKPFKFNHLTIPSIFSTEGSHARTSALQDLERAWQESEAGYFSRSCAWPKKSSPSSYSLKMWERSDREEELKCLDRLPNWGMTQGFALYPLRPLEHPIKENAGLCLPTPNTMDHLPPRSTEAQKRVFQTHRKGRTTPSNLREWIIPEMWPTPKASECKRAGIKSESKRDNPSLWYRVYERTGKKLNVLFVEWMMSYPIGWTELSPWATQWLSLKRKRRSKSSWVSKNKEKGGTIASK